MRSAITILQNFDAAEKSARQGMKNDDSHQLPKMEYLLGVILMLKHEYQEAAQPTFRTIFT